MEHVSEQHLLVLLEPSLLQHKPSEHFNDWILPRRPHAGPASELKGLLTSKSAFQSVQLCRNQLDLLRNNRLFHWLVPRVHRREIHAQEALW